MRGESPQNPRDTAAPNPRDTAAPNPRDTAAPNPRDTAAPNPRDTAARWDAADYAKSSAAQRGWAQELIGKLSLAGGETVLDLGCGDGRVTAELARRVPRGAVVGCDNSAEMIRAARSAFPREKHPNLSFELADAQALDYAARFDVTFSNAALHWVKDQPAVLRGVARALKPGGRVLFQMGGRGNGAEIFAVAGLMVESAAWREHFAGFAFPWSFNGPEEYIPWCAAAGLRVLRAELLPKDMIQQGRDGLASWIRTTWMPYTARVPEVRRDQFIREAADRYLAAHPLTARGEAVVRMVRLEVEAVRD
jgi:trans-aconitate 2-methyltransferase